MLDILKDLNKHITIISKNISAELTKKYQRQYQKITFIHNNSFHNSFILIDKQTLYHCVSSFKDLNKKYFAINKIEDKNILDNFIKEIFIYKDNINNNT